MGGLANFETALKFSNKKFTETSSSTDTSSLSVSDDKYKLKKKKVSKSDERHALEKRKAALETEYSKIKVGYEKDLEEMRQITRKLEILEQKTTENEEINELALEEGVEKLRNLKIYQ